MTIKDYAEVLKFAIKINLDSVNEELSEAIIIDESYLQGVKTGLQIALEKIDASMFLVEKN